MVTAVRFSNGQEAFPLTTAAQNIPVFLRKSPLCRNHFFGWSKTANSSTAYGTATLKSLLPQAFAVSNVHPRPRKYLSRCTLDCGFKTSESPALRGFVTERGPIRGTSLYLVLKSNGLRHSKNSPVKFGFSPKIVPAYIVKKLPSQRCPQPLLIPIFNFSHKWPTFAFTGESGYTLGPAQRIAHKGTHGETGAFPSANTARLCAASEIATKRKAGENGCTPMACVRFLRRRGPAGLRCPNCQSVHTVYLSLQIVRDSLPICRILARFT